jgi:HTH-type transcriptional regulator, transcriptional repressor of NAD biosynthesis genes
MVKGFVFGKFLPFHKGHEAMIRFALSECDFLSVLVCCSDKETISGSVRKSWIEETFLGFTNMEVLIFSYKEDDLPNTSVSSRDVSQVWAKAFQVLVPDCKLLVTSEPYGDFVADYMDIRHLSYDMSRIGVPISATSIRSDLFANWHFLPESVKPYYAIKVVILGTESSGKSTLTQNLADYFGCNCVTEAGRDLIADSKSFEFEDLYLVANEHALRIQKAILGDSPLLIIDTNIYTTMSYAQFIFGQDLLVDGDIIEVNTGNLYLYLNRDVTYHQDGTRLSLEQRNLLDVSHREILEKNGIVFAEISGDWKERFEQSVKLITKLI